MLYLIHMQNHPGLAYQGGQQPIVHLQADLRKVITWATERGRQWAISLSNASAAYTEFSSDLDDALERLNWEAIGTRSWSNPLRKDGKQAEFLVFSDFPWTAIELIGVYEQQVGDRVRAAIANCAHKPQVVVQRGWYY